MAKAKVALSKHDLQEQTQVFRSVQRSITWSCWLNFLNSSGQLRNITRPVLSFVFRNCADAWQRNSRRTSADDYWAWKEDGSNASGLSREASPNCRLKADWQFLRNSTGTIRMCKANLGRAIFSVFCLWVNFLENYFTVYSIKLFFVFELIFCVFYLIFFLYLRNLVQSSQSHSHSFIHFCLKKAFTNNSSNRGHRCQQIL